jgi:NAD(P)-dependent dehydrogenase (short-subunit alcohol dehydrogenase family)
VASSSSERLKGRNAIVTGAASGLGRAIALRFAEEGANVVVSDVRETPIWDRDDERPTAELIEERGGKAIYVQADVSKTEDVDRLVSTTVSEFGRLDIMVNNAAVFEATNILDTTEEAWDALMDVNLRGQFLCCKRAIAEMIGQDPVNDVRGRVINLSSQHGMVGPPDFFAYGVSKGGMVQMTRALAVDYGKHGIIVNAVAPGRILTGTHPSEAAAITGELKGDEKSVSGDPGLDYSHSRTPFPRLGRPEDVAGAALFLASDDCSYISGHNLLVDGGWMAY